MATISKITASNAFYGYSSYSNPAAVHMYVGAQSETTKYDYRSRITLPPLSQAEGVDGGRIRINRMTLKLRRNDGGPTEIRIGCSALSAWGAAEDAYVTAEIPGATGVYEVDVTPLAEAAKEYEGNWYLHFSGLQPRLRLDGTGKSTGPSIEMEWEYEASTISSNFTGLTLGLPVTFTIAPEVEGETHTLRYFLGGAQGVIAENAGNTVVWQTPEELAAEFPEEERANVRIRMEAFGPDGSLLRTEAHCITVMLPAEAKPRIAEHGSTVTPTLGGFILCGTSALELAPVIDMNGAMGARLTEVRAELSDGQSLRWDQFTETEPGIFTVEPKRTGVIENQTDVLVDYFAVDSRGRTGGSSQGIFGELYTPPQVTAFAVERCEPVYDENEEIAGYVSSDSGSRLWVTVQAQAASVAPWDEELNALHWELTGVCGEKTVSASGSGGVTLDVVNDLTVLPDPVGDGETWQYTLRVRDNVLSAGEQDCAVLPGHAAFSISPDKWGAAVGMAATGTKSAPRFEVSKEYASHFYGGAFDRGGREIVGAALAANAYESGGMDVPTGTNVDFPAFTAAEDGLYLICFTGSWAGNAEGIRAVILMDPAGTTRALSRIHSGGAGAIQQNGTALMPLKAGESAMARVWQNSGGALKLTYHICQAARIGG